MAQSTITESAVSLNVNPSAPTGPVLKLVDGRPVVSSREVATHFGKQHHKVMESIRSIIRNAPESFGSANFGGSLDMVQMPNGIHSKEVAIFMMTKTGFSLLAMGFTGLKALKWKIAYIQAFEAMEAEMSGQTALTGTITAAMQQEIKELVQAKASAFPDADKPKVFSQMWMRLQRHFKIPRYAELPVSLFGEARDYIISMKLNRVDAPALPSAEPVPALPEAPRRVTFEDYQKLYPGLVCGPQHWELLRDRIYTAMAVFMSELKAVEKEAINPFQANRKSNVQNYLDAAMGPMYSLWNSSEETLRMSYKNAYDALDGCRDTWLLLNKG